MAHAEFISSSSVLTSHQKLKKDNIFLLSEPARGPCHAKPMNALAIIANVRELKID
jgi:hypothetical protein